MKVWQVIRISAMAALLLLLFIGMLTGAYFLTASLYHAIGHTPPPLVMQVLNSLLGVALYALSAIAIIGAINATPGSRRRWMGLIEPILQAMERIAKGDFQVRLQPKFASNTLVHELTTSVNQMALELGQMEHLRQDFISNVSHEIQSPLTSIRGFAEALHDEQLSAADRHHYLTIIETESMRLSRMTDNILKLASLDSEHTRIDRKPYRLDKQIRALIVACEPQWTGKRINMDAVLDEIVITADEDLLSQVWSNLLHNSIRFTPEGGRVAVEVQRQGDQIACRITDT